MDNLDDLIDKIRQEEIPVEQEKDKKKVGRKRKLDSTAGYAEYETSHIMKLIGLVESRECLWNNAHINWSRNETKRSEWDQIERACQHFIRIHKTGSGKNAESLWSGLLSDWTKEHKRLQNAPSGSGVERISKFQYYNAMQFLVTVQQNRSVQNCWSFDDNLELSRTAHSPKSERKKSTKPEKSDPILKSFERNADRLIEAVMATNPTSNGDSTKPGEHGEILIAMNSLFEGKGEVEKLRLKSKVLNFIFELGEMRPATSDIPSTSVAEPSYDRLDYFTDFRFSE